MAVYLYKPPIWRNVQTMEKSLRYGVLTSTVVYRQSGVWHNVMTAGVDDPVVADVDVEPRTGLRLFFNKPMVIPEEIHDELAALEPADPSWSAGELILL